MSHQFSNHKQHSSNSQKKYFLFITCIYLLNLIWTGIFSFSFGQEDTTKIRALLDSAMIESKPLTEAEKIGEDALKLADKLNFLRGKADAFEILGRINLKTGDYPESMNYFFEALSLREKNPDWINSSVARTYAYIGETYRAISNYELSLEYLNKAAMLSEEKKDIEVMAYTYNRLAAVYFEMSYKTNDSKASSLSFDYANKSQAISQNKNYLDLTISNFNILGGITIVRGDTITALKYYTNALNEMNKDSTYQDKPNILNNLANLYNGRKEYDKAIQYGLQSYEISKKSGMKIYIIEATRGLSDVYRKKGDYINAFNYLLEAHGLYLQLFDEKKSAEINALQKKYETTLSEQEDHSKSVRRYIAGTALLLLIFGIGGGLYFKHRNQVRLNSELAVRNELISSQKEQLAESNAAKDKFFSIISHDLKNPLHGILGFSNLLDTEFDKIDDDEKKQYIVYLKASSEYMNKLVERILTWSRLTTGRIKVQKERINLYEIVSSIVDFQKVNAIRKGIMLENNVKDNLYVNTDSNVLDTVLRNLLDNAVKFSEEGGKVVVDTNIKGTEVEISVTDTGVGMKEEDLARLFNIDQKTVSKGTFNEQGTGLGLIICKEMLGLLGIELKVDSFKTAGSIFYFSLPLSD